MRPLHNPLVWSVDANVAIPAGKPVDRVILMGVAYNYMMLLGAYHGAQAAMDDITDWVFSPQSVKPEFGDPRIVLTDGKKELLRMEFVDRVHYDKSSCPPIAERDERVFEITATFEGTTEAQRLWQRLFVTGVLSACGMHHQRGAPDKYADSILRSDGKVRGGTVHFNPFCETDCKRVGDFFNFSEEFAA